MYSIVTKKVQTKQWTLEPVEVANEGKVAHPRHSYKEESKEQPKSPEYKP